MRKPQLISKAQLLGVKQVLSTPSLRAQLTPHEMQAIAVCLADMAASGPTALVQLTAECTALL